MSLKEALRNIAELGDDLLVEAKDTEFLPTGFSQLDKNIKGFPRGRIVEVYGPESSGKTTMILQALALAQKTCKCAFIDAEHSFDRKFSEQLGVDLKELILITPSTGEQVIESIKLLSDSGEVGMIVIDSVANMVPQNELEKEMGKEIMGMQAKMLARGLRKITSSVFHNNVSVIFINQLRDRIGVMFGNPETTPGGKALRYYASMRLSVRSSERLKRPDGSEYGFVTNVKLEKSKLGSAKSTAQLTFLHGEGFSKAHDRLYTMIEDGTIEKKGGWYVWQGKQYQGEKNMLLALKDSVA